MTKSVATTAAWALLRSGLLSPPNPAALVRLMGEVRRGGTNPYTLLAVAAARWPNRAAIIDDDGALSYRELQSETEALARQLLCEGVGPGQAVGILCRNGRGFVRAVFATALVGADVVLVNTDFRIDALAAALSAHQIETIVSEAEFAGGVHAADEAVTVIDAVAATASGPRPKVAASGGLFCSRRAPRTNRRACPAHRVCAQHGRLGDYPGSHRAAYRIADLGGNANVSRSGTRHADVYPRPRGTVITHRHFDAEAALAQASLHRADAFTAVPVVLARILDLPHAVRARNPVPALRAVISSGDRLDPSLAQRFMETYGDILYNGYGSTEVGIGALATPADLRRAPETVGKPVAGCPVRIFDDNRQARRTACHRANIRRWRAGV